MALVPDEPQESIIQNARRYVYYSILFNNLFNTLIINLFHHYHYFYREFLTEKVILQIPDETLGGDILNEEEDGGGGDEGGASGGQAKPDIKFPIHTYTGSGNKVNFDLTADIPIPPPAPKKKKLFKKND